VSVTTVTLRAQLKSEVSDLLSDANMSCVETEEAIVTLAVDLADHREEGQPLFPRVLICDDLHQVLRVLQGSNPIKIGAGDRTAQTAILALKKCAPLATGGWAMWIDRQPGAFEFGVFREPLVPTAIDLKTTLHDLEPGAIKALLAAQIAAGAVEIVGVGGRALHVHLSGMRSNRAAQMDEEPKLLSWFLESVADEGRLREACTSFAKTMLHDAMRQSHGALVAVVAAGAEIPAALTSDAVVLDEPAELVTLVGRHTEDGSSEALAELLAYSSLLGGMLRSDGIVVIDSGGRILAFNCFLKTDISALAPRELVGGARLRAYMGLCRLVDEHALRGAFVRSSNGECRAHGDI